MESLVEVVAVYERRCRVGIVDRKVGATVPDAAGRLGLSSGRAFQGHAMTVLSST